MSTGNVKKFLYGLIKNIAYFPGRCVGTITEKNPAMFKYTLSVVVIVKNEADYIEEWLRFHEAVGIDHIYLYNNESSDATRELILPFVKKGFVTLVDFPGKGMQFAAYNHAIKNHKFDSKYMAFIDADEFLRPVDTQIELKACVEKLFSDNPKASGIAVNWRMFGSSGHVSRPNEGGVLDNYVYRASPGKPGNSCIKTVANPRRIYRYGHAHYPIYNTGGFSVDENGNKVIGWRDDIQNPSIICINHYFTKSKEEWIKRRSIGKADSTKANNVRTLDDFFAHDNNDIFDDSMLVYIKRMRLIQDGTNNS